MGYALKNDNPYIFQMPGLEKLGEKDKKEPKLRKDGKPKQTANHKEKGRKSEVFAFEVEDMRKVLSKFESEHQWLYYLLFTVNVNTARRIGDILSLKWKHFYNVKTGEFRKELLEIREDKTDKIANPYINDAVKDAIKLYIEKTGCNPAKNDYEDFVFTQLSGNYRGKVVSAYGYRKALKKVAEEVGIEYNVGTHSARKTFGKTSRMLHPEDYDSLEILGSIFNHSDTKTTKSYIGMTKEKKDKYYQDIGQFFNEYVVGDNDFSGKTEEIMVHLDVNDMRNLLKSAYELGMANVGAEISVHLDAINRLMNDVDKIKK